MAEICPAARLSQCLAERKDPRKAEIQTKYAPPSCIKHSISNLRGHCRPKLQSPRCPARGEVDFDHATKLTYHDLSSKNTFYPIILISANRSERLSERKIADKIFCHRDSLRWLEGVSRQESVCQTPAHSGRAKSNALMSDRTHTRSRGGSVAIRGYSGMCRVANESLRWQI